MSQQLNLPVKLGGVSLNEKTDSIGVDISLDQISVEDAHATICESQLAVLLKLGKEGQASLGDINPKPIEATCHAKRLSMGKDNFTFRLQFAPGTVDVTNLGHYKFKEATLIVERTGPAGVDSGDGEDEDLVGEDEDPDQMKIG